MGNADVHVSKSVSVLGHETRLDLRIGRMSSRCLGLQCTIEGYRVTAVGYGCQLLHMQYVISGLEVIWSRKWALQAI